MQVLRLNGVWHINNISIYDPNVSEDTINEWGYFLYDHRESNPHLEEPYQIVLNRQYELQSNIELCHIKHTDATVTVPPLIAAGLIKSGEWIKIE